MSAKILAEKYRPNGFNIGVNDGEAAEFDPPDDRRRFFEAGDNQIAGVGDGFERNSPPWIDSVKGLRPDFPVYGSMIECAECLTRLIGQENTMLWMGLYPERMGVVLNRIGEFYLQCAKAPMAPRPLLERIATIRSMDVILPTQTRVDLRLHVVSQPEKPLALLLDRLGLLLPGRPKMISNVVQNLTPLDPNSLANGEM